MVIQDNGVLPKTKTMARAQYRETTGVGLCDEPGHKADATNEGSGWLGVRARLMGGKFKM